MRVQRFLAQAGVASRRKAEDLIRQGRVTVNGLPVALGARVEAKDEVRLDGRLVRPFPAKLYYLFYKPRGVLTTLSDPSGRPTVADFLRDVEARLFPVGRLDRDSEGLLVLTNDGEFAKRLTHPRYHVAKTYAVTVRGHPQEDELTKIARGLSLPGLVTAPCDVAVRERARDRTRLWMTVYEGQNRLLRRVFEAFGYEVLRLQRVAIGPVTDARLRPGQKRPLTEGELRALWRAGGRDESQEG